MRRESHTTAASESTAAVAIAKGRECAWKLERNSASRTALPATACAMRMSEVAAAQFAPGVFSG